MHDLLGWLITRWEREERVAVNLSSGDTAAGIITDYCHNAIELDGDTLIPLHAISSVVLITPDTEATDVPAS